MAENTSPETATVLCFPIQPIPDQGAVDMERVNQFAIYELGQTLEHLRIPSPVDAQNAYRPLMRARHTLTRLLQGDPVPIGISTGKTNLLKDLVNNALDWFYYERDDTGNQILDENGKPKFKWPKRGETIIEDWWWSSITDALAKFETVLAEEMRESPSYHVPQRGLSSVSVMVESGEKAFPEALMHVLGIKAVADFKAACRCFAFDLYTASGYHSARAVEAVLETYYQTFMNKPGETLNGWNDYVEALKKIKDKKKPMPKFIPDGRTLLSVDEIRFHHRNPLMHPRAVLSDIDADMLLSTAKVAMIAMAQEIQNVWSEKKAIAIKIKAKQKA